MSRWLGFAGICGLALIFGCQEGELPAPASDASSAVEADGPEMTVFDFLSAVKNGNDEEASGKLTTLARSETEKMGMMVAPQGSDTASFEIGQVEFEGDSKEIAQVESTWTDVDEEGQPHSDTIVWILRHEPEGWRIAGMGTYLFEDADPMILDFENCEDMQRKLDLAEEEMARRTEAAADGSTEQASLPDTGESTRR